jgi:potassium-transporting ATPase potassium-binding subunit
MSSGNLLQCGLYLAVLLVLVRPVGAWMARVYEGSLPRSLSWLRRCERGAYRVAGIDPANGMTWKAYAAAMLVFNVLGIVVVYALQRLQAHLPLNSAAMPAVPPDLAFNTAVSFATNTNWQSYGGETTLGSFVQMAGLTVQNFVSAGTGMAVLVATIRGFVQKQAATIGNFWVDLVRSTVYILLPLALVLSLALVSQGVVQTFRPFAKAALLQPAKDTGGSAAAPQSLALGPAASQVAIKQLGTNGGGFFNANSCHPFENPTPFADMLEVLAILLLAAAFCHTFGCMVRDRRQGWALLAAMLVLFVPCLLFCVQVEQRGNPLLTKLGVDQQAGKYQPGGNMEGKEARFGIAQSAVWAVATTAASNGSVNSMHDSYTPLGGMVALWLMELGEVVFGGVGSGLYGMLAFVIVAVFIAGLMIGRTPEYLGKKIEVYEMKMAALVLLVPHMCVLTGTAVAVLLPRANQGILNPGPHGFSEMLYAFASAGNNNGSAFAGLAANTFFYNTALGIVMFVARYWLAIPMLAIAGSLARKKVVPAGAGTLPTHTPLFVVFLVMVVVVVGALTFFPALALGPIVEHLMLAAP